MDDRQLLLDYVRHDSSGAFTTLVERHVDLVYSAALRRMQGDHHRATEVTQQVFTDLVRKASRLTGHPTLAGWLHRSTQWSAARLRRGEQRRFAHEQAAAREWELVAPSDADAREWETIRPWLDGALDRLRDGERDAVLLRYFSRRSYAEIAAHLGIGENAARMRVERALERLRTHLRRHGITSSATALSAILTQQAVSAAPAGLVATVAPAALAAGGTAGILALAFAFLLGHVNLILVTALAVILAFGLRDDRARQAVQRSALAALRQEHAAQQAELSRLTRQAEASRAAQRSLPEPADLPPPDPVQQERKQLDVVVRKGELDIDYAPLFRRVRLDPVSLDALKGLIVERNQSIYDAFQLAKVEGVILSHPEGLAVERAAARVVDAQIATLLGPEKFAAFEHHQATLRIRRNLLPATLADDPARDEQAEKLVGLFQRLAPNHFTAETAASLPLPLPEEFLQQAEPFLTANEARNLREHSARLALLGRMTQISRAAAYAGKLKLSRSSARDYAMPPRQPADASRP